MCNEAMMNPKCRAVGSKVTGLGTFGDRNTHGKYEEKIKQTRKAFLQDTGGEAVKVPLLPSLGRI